MNLGVNRGANGIRTRDPHTASVMRYQLRHSPVLFSNGLQVTAQNWLPTNPLAATVFLLDLAGPCGVFLDLLAVDKDAWGGYLAVTIFF